MANFMTPGLIKRLRSRWRSSGTRFMKRCAPGFPKDCLRLSARFIVVTRGLQKENGSLPAQLRQRRDLQNCRRLAMTIKTSRRCCGVPNQEVGQKLGRKPDQKRRSPTRPRRQATLQKRLRRRLYLGLLI